MKDVIKKINDFLGMTTGLLINLIVAGTIIGILYDDMFGVIAGIGNAVNAIGDGGVAENCEAALLIQGKTCISMNSGP